MYSTTESNVLKALFLVPFPPLKPSSHGYDGSVKGRQQGEILIVVIHFLTYEQGLDLTDPDTSAVHTSLYLRRLLTLL